MYLYKPYELNITTGNFRYTVGNHKRYSKLKETLENLMVSCNDENNLIRLYRELLNLCVKHKCFIKINPEKAALYRKMPFNVIYSFIISRKVNSGSLSRVEYAVVEDTLCK